jgi:2-amino-4-hydroxy-6-hydroxymethyldihydropteridine diphosphokinase
MASVNIVAIAVGSNIDPKNNITKGQQMLASRFTLLDASEMVETAPVGYVDQADFFNGAFLIETELPIKKLQQSLCEIESACNRLRTKNKFGPRTLDLDIVVFNNKIINKDFHNRPFVRDAILSLLPNLTV